MNSNIDFSVVNSPDFTVEQVLELSDQICVIPEMRLSL